MHDRQISEALSSDDAPDRPAIDADPADVARIVGARIRARRTERGMRLKDLAEAAGLKQPFLSQLERGHASPSMHSLYRLAQALEVTPGDLMPPVDPVPGARVVRAHEGRRIESTDTAAGFVRLIVSDSHHPVELSEIEVDESRNNNEWFENPNAAATYVIDGRLDVEIERSQKYSLGPGDAIFYPPNVRSLWTAVGSNPTRLLHVVARPPQPRM